MAASLPFEAYMTMSISHACIKRFISEKNHRIETIVVASECMKNMSMHKSAYTHMCTLFMWICVCDFSFLKRDTQICMLRRVHSNFIEECGVYTRTQTCAESHNSHILPTWSHPHRWHGCSTSPASVWCTHVSACAHVCMYACMHVCMHILSAPHMHNLAAILGDGSVINTAPKGLISLTGASKSKVHAVWCVLWIAWNA